MSNEVTFKTMMKDTNFMKLFLARIISRFGDSVDMVAYAMMVYNLTGSKVLMAVLYGVNGIPSLIFSMISGVVVTRMPKKMVIWVCDFLRGAVVLVTATFYLMGILEVWHLFLFTVLNSTFEAFRAPAASAIFIQLIEKDKIEHATSLDSSGKTFAELIGYVVAGIIIGTVTVISSQGVAISVAIFIDAATFIIAGIIIMTIVREKEILVKTKLTLKVYFTELKEGFVYVNSHPIMMTITLFFGCFMLIIAPFNALQTAFVLETLDLGAFGITVMSIAFMIAMIGGSLMVPSLTAKFGGRKIFLFGGTIIGLGYLLFGFIDVFKGTMMGYVALGIVAFVMGSTITFVQVPISAALMRKVDQNFATRVFAIVNVLSLAAVPIGGGLSGLAVRYVSIPTMFIFTSIAIILLFVAQIFNKSLYELNYEPDTHNDESAIISDDPQEI